MMRRELILKSIIMLAILVVATTSAQADFDWRNVGGNDYMTPVQNQGACGSCWAFGAVAALEAKFDIYYNNPDLNLNLSEQHLLCEGSMGDCDGGWEYLACNYFVSDGITDEATLPYLASDTSPLWPPTDPDLYGVTANQNWIDNSTADLKTALQEYGPLVCAIDVYNDFYTPVGTRIGWTIPDYYEQYLDDDKAGAINHCVAITGWVDDAELDAGGYWIVKNSWGSTWGPTGDGYGYCLFGAIEQHDRIHALTGDPWTNAVVPLPGAVLLGILGLGAVGIKLRKYA